MSAAMVFGFGRLHAGGRPGNQSVFVTLDGMERPDTLCSVNFSGQQIPRDPGSFYVWPVNWYLRLR